VPSAGLLLLAYVAFVSLGLPDAVLGVAWPSLRAAFVLSQTAMGAALAAHVAGYLASSVLAGRASAALGVGGVLASSTALVAAGLTGLALAPAWAVFVTCALLVGLGSGAIDAAINAYAAVHLPHRHMSWLHACYGAGAAAGPVVMTAALATASFRAGYAALAAAMTAMAVAFLATRRRWERGAAGPRAAASLGAALRHPLVPLQAGIFFVYAGLEASAGQWAFTVLRETRGVGLEAAGAWTAAYWACLGAGRVAAGFAVRRASPDGLVRAGTLGAAAGAALYAVLPGASGAFGLVLLGLSLAPIFPVLMSRTPDRLGAAVTGHAVGLQVAAATLGVAALPSAHGAVADAFGAGAIPIASACLAALLAALYELLHRAAPPPAAAPRAPCACPSQRV
jgi:fucose permease